MGNTIPRTTGERCWRLALFIGSGAVLLFLITPILAVVPLSFNDSQFLAYPVRGFTWRWYEELLTSQRWALSVRNSFVIGIAAALLASILGTLAAIGLNISDFRGKASLTAVLLSPMVVPVVIYAVGLYLFFAPLGLTQTYTGLIMAHAALGAPFVVVTVSAVLANFDWALVRAAQSLGAHPITVFRTIMLPLLTPGVLSGALFAFATSFDEVVTLLLIGGPQHRTMPREMFSRLREDISPTIAAAAALMLVTAVLLLITVEWLKARTARMTRSP
ncbi:ABC transporter permease [Reyranella sp. CPCC 100927]|uniref:ABC transporter permease n=1 Tax=Reyranella sp. CPCC 100927 TaxID=2599616 RepID=UPI0011B6D58D|nr:ABC transporter permease [Reyranella sp. CPCC 100927]TWS96609.1 ABC transporter permease [Reyranella sp. CPCC 100927]